MHTNAVPACRFRELISSLHWITASPVALYRSCVQIRCKLACNPVQWQFLNAAFACSPVGVLNRQSWLMALVTCVPVHGGGRM